MPDFSAIENFLKETLETWADAEIHTVRKMRKTINNCVDPMNTWLLPLFWFLGLQQGDAYIDQEHGLNEEKFPPFPSDSAVSEPGTVPGTAQC